MQNFSDVRRRWKLEKGKSISTTGEVNHRPSEKTLLVYAIEYIEFSITVTLFRCRRNNYRLNCSNDDLLSP